MTLEQMESIELRCRVFWDCGSFRITPIVDRQGIRGLCALKYIFLQQNVICKEQEGSTESYSPFLLCLFHLCPLLHGSRLTSEVTGMGTL